MTASAAASLSKSGDMKLSSISPFDASSPLTISGAVLKSPVLSGADISASNVKAETMQVSGVVEMGADVFVSGSLNVRGTVIGSGPYMDSSDKRFKTNITAVDGALAKVIAMNGVSSHFGFVHIDDSYNNFVQVTYDNRCDEFPSRKFDRSRQVGWIADDMALIVPELVSEDDAGYKAISYSRVGPILGEAIKELKRESDERFNDIDVKVSTEREELVALRQEVAGLQNAVNALAEDNRKLNDLVNALLKRLD